MTPPRIIVSATDLVRAKPFSFTREQLNGICVDRRRSRSRGGVRIGSDADLFRATVMRTYRGSMRLCRRTSIERRCRSSPMFTEKSAGAPAVASTAKFHLHLVDGAFADNLGTRDSR
jgi:hypothetical protein